MSEHDVKKVLIFGSTGQLGSSLDSVFNRDINFACIALTREEVDLNDTKKIVFWLEKYNPHYVINAAAYNNVIQAEKDMQTALAINALAPAVIAHWCHSHGVTFISYSTDYVFSGRGTVPYKENQETGPLNAYGRSKLQGEKMIAKEGGSWYIFRTSWVYSPIGKNFYTTVLDLFHDEKKLKFVDDQIGAPTYAFDLAIGTYDVLKKMESGTIGPSGIYHMCNAGKASWYEFAKRILKNASEHDPSLKDVQIHSVSSAEYNAPVKRPLNSRLSNEKLKSTFGIELRDWEKALDECMEHHLK